MSINVVSSIVGTLGVDKVVFEERRLVLNISNCFLSSDKPCILGSSINLDIERFFAELRFFIVLTKGERFLETFFIGFTEGERFFETFFTGFTEGERFAVFLLCFLATDLEGIL